MPGYKRTEAGVIPYTWACDQLAEFITFISYGFTNPMPTVNEGIYMLTAADINKGRLQLETARKTSEQAYRLLLTGKSKPRPNDILLTKDGTLGRLALVKDEIVCINQSVAVMRPNNRVEPQFLKLLLESPQCQKRMIEDAGGSTIKHIYITIVDKMPLGLPLDKAEQRAIAEALSDVDALVDSLDRFIAKKRDLKQAAMQQLLTGQTRLPGFSGEWEVKQLDEIADVFKGSSLSKSSITPTGLYPCILYGELFTSYRRVINKIFSRTNLREGLLSIAGDVLLPASTTTTGADLATASALLIDDVALGGDILVIRKKGEKYDPVFLASYLSHTAKHQIAELTQGITIHHLYGKSLKTLPLHIPSLPEQTAIATALNEMDAELFALEQRRNKTVALKQGMMQELLTGRTRLV